MYLITNLNQEIPMATLRIIKKSFCIYEITLRYCNINLVHSKMQSQTFVLEIFCLQIYSHISNSQM